MAKKTKKSPKKEPLKHFTVELRRALVSGISVEVEATDEDHAVELAHEKADNLEDEWEFIDETNEVEGVWLSNPK